MSARSSSPTDRAKHHSPSREAKEKTPIVGIGASAGGLEPIKRLLSELPVGSGLAYVVIQHLDPAGKSALPELLSKHTQMTVASAADGTVVLPNHVYIIPPGVYLSIEAGTLRLTSTEGKSAVLPIDVFLNSLARDCGRHGIGIILSGSGTDGGDGLRALRDAGGLAVVQDPHEATHNSMPEHAVRVARPDFVLPVSEMPVA